MLLKGYLLFLDCNVWNTDDYAKMQSYFCHGMVCLVQKWLGHHWHLNPSPWQVQMLSQLLFCFVANSLTDLKRRVLFSYWCSLTITLCVFYYHNYRNQWHILRQHPLMSGKQQLKGLFMVYTAWQLYTIHIHTLRNLGVNSWEGRLKFCNCAKGLRKKAFGVEFQSFSFVYPSRKSQWNPQMPWARRTA